jgi:Arc/MetJ family transcription regulator
MKATLNISDELMEKGMDCIGIQEKRNLIHIALES